MAMFHTNVLDNQIKALPTVGTASGSVASFDTDMTEDLIEVVCDIQYSQGSGVPSPSNPLPITTYTSLNLSHSGADTSNPTVTNIPFGQSVAKGTLDVLSGKLTITHQTVNLSDYVNSFTRNITQSNPNGTIYQLDIAVIFKGWTVGGSDDAICSHFQKSSTPSVATADENSFYWTTARTGYRVIFGDAYGGSTLTDLQTFLNNNNVIICGELYEPIIVQLTSNQITALLNENNIWCDTNGDTTVKYLLTVGKAIS